MCDWQQRNHCIWRGWKKEVRWVWFMMVYYGYYLMAVWNRGVGWLWLQQKYIRKGNKFIIFIKRCEWEREIWQPNLLAKKREGRKTRDLWSVKCVCVASLSLLLCINILLPSYHFSVFASLITTLLICLSFCSSLVDFWLRFFCNTTTYTQLPLFFFSFSLLFLTRIPSEASSFNLPFSQIYI